MVTKGSATPLYIRLLLSLVRIVSIREDEFSVKWVGSVMV